MNAQLEFDSLEEGPRLFGNNEDDILVFDASVFLKTRLKH